MTRLKVALLHFMLQKMFCAHLLKKMPLSTQNYHMIRNQYVQTIIKAMHNLSELLLFHFPNACALEEHNYEALKHVISNLDARLMKDILRTNKQEPVIPLGDISQELGESYDMGSVAGKLQVISEVVKSHAPPHVHEEKINYNFSGNEVENSLHFLPLRDDVDIGRDDDLAQAIKKILDKNFHCNEEMPSKAHLFRNLWLETEAKLCSISCKARFGHMKIEMETIKSNRAKDGIIPKSTLQNSSISSTSGC
ncbi:hypothetical protein Fot_03608 [Forsythia ovata]|uniref:Uncharacterized protein n=1 Tax=Forsythia ovata TaxID=205694 RepID=A0ABD1XA65_9LAMI